MSSPTSSEPDERDPAVTPTTSDPGSPPRSAALGTTPAGQHAAERPYPPSDPLTAPPASPSPGDRRLVDDRTVVDADHPTAPVAAPPVAAPAAAPVTAPAGTETRQSRREVAELPEPPRKPGFGRHLLGILLGLLLTPVALLLTGIGTARLADAAGSRDAATDALGVSLLIAGAVLLVVVVLLGVWSPAVPITGGLVWGVALGTAYLVVPALLDDVVAAMAGDRVVPAAIDQLTESAMSGHLLVTGALLVAAGWATARARRIGRRWAEEMAAAEAARAQVRSTTRTPA